MSVTPDLFDILGVSLSGDAYSGLIASILRRSREITSGVFRALTGRRLTGKADVRFTREIGRGQGRNRSDIVVEGPTARGPWLLVIEATVESGEGWTQTRRYWYECDKEVWNGARGGYSLFFMTPNGESTDDMHWTPLTHRQLAQVISQHDRAGLLADDPVISVPWRAYTARLEHLSAFEAPNDDEPFVDWLLNSPDEYFVTRRQRAYHLGHRLFPSTYTLKPSVNVAKGREQFLVLAWLPCWKTGYWGSGMRFEDCVHVHFEFDMPVPFRSPYATCRLHCESNPYMREKQVKKLVDSARGFLEFMDCLREEIHQRLQGTSWKPSNRWLHKAYFPCPMTKETTIAELRAYLAPRLDEARDKVTAALVAAGQRCHLGWWRRVKAQSSRT